MASARAIVVSRYYDRDAVELAIQSEVAIAYMNMLLARERLRISDDTIRNFEEVLRIADARLEAGAATSLDVTQQRSALATARAGRALFVEQVSNAENALAVLLGDAAGTVRANGTGIAALKVPKIDTGQPAAILYRRPDIRRARGATHRRQRGYRRGPRGALPVADARSQRRDLRQSGNHRPQRRFVAARSHLPGRPAQSRRGA